MDKDTITEQFKEGWKTSEFWLALVMLAAPIVAAFSDYEIDTEQLGAAVPAVIYIFGRSWLKRKRVDALVNTAPTVPTDLALPDPLDDGVN